ncbi:hypothetical protein MSNKSG1_18155 [Marinobacter santoriniensis NKSG1]|uniref:Nucleoside-diphosphate sugar epimerase n=1 Tax=Marinobacter santoriniensis NKSG1 TaxID=1288826 RepID=M7CZU4_9GAMM|nr:ELM1/GtrOC1 family putative glycosyltransferase [Marinobacter santoriniensis]EMP54023.1 hypothetical protein MSNKSG1_18155 [Marinobacter santoriniensis NKSG1]
MEDQHTPVVWLITDGKPGHRNQLKGLGNRLRVLAGASLHWLDAREISTPLWRVLLGAPPALPDLPDPDLIVAAGTGTHRLILALRRVRNSKTLVLMKPSFPLNWVDAAIIPEHDDVSASDRVLVSEGVINSITPLAKLTTKHEALVLIGGPSPHFHWDSDAIASQLSQLPASYPDWRWTISDSRRTPADLRQRLAELAAPRVTVVSSDQTHENWLAHQLSASRAAWVTPDSMSMVCEAVTSGVPTGLLELPSKGHSRVALGIARLAERGRIAHWRDHPAVMSARLRHDSKLWEADRAARWVIKRFWNPGHK